MASRVWYNEIDPFAAAWLRELIKAGAIAPGDVDERSIEDVRPSDLAGYTQCHFFAGIGVWSYALRRAGWADDRPVWTGSCPCQPFSAAGKGGGFSDERHLWPAFHWLIEQCRPPVVLGEQVASKDGLAWLDLVQADLEGTGYASRAVDLCAAGVGAPHIRQRLWWIGERVADAYGRDASAERQQRGGEQRQQPEDGRVGRMADLPGSGRREERADAGRLDARDRAQGQPAGFGASGGDSGLAHASLQGLEGRDARPMGRQRAAAERNGGGEPAHQPAAGPTNSFWRDADWLFCRDGKWRPVEPGSFPLVARAAGSVGSGGDFSAQIDAPTAEARVGRLRGYGNAINAEAAIAFIEAYQDVEHLRLTAVSLPSPIQQDDGVFG